MATRERVSIQRVRPEVLGGRHPAKGIVDEPVEVHADLVCDSHDLLAAVVRYRSVHEAEWHERPMVHEGNDAWSGRFVPDRLGRYEFVVESWVDRIGTWRRDLAVKADAASAEHVDLAVGAYLIWSLVPQAEGQQRRRLEETARSLFDRELPVATRIEVGLSDEVAAAARQLDPRAHAVRSPEALEVQVDRRLARFSSWYELFPRSASTRPGTHGTFRDVIDRLDYVEALGFDVLYLPPIHPIGFRYRKGRNNAEVAAPDDPGSPWAIGSPQGGHKSIHPELGSMEDFHALVAACRQRDMELALDIAFQCSADHPYLDQHPEWFRQRPDGTIQYAENPPKKYQDIYPFDFETSDADGLWRELKSIFEFWIEQGVRVFRVDNPHTKSFPFWQWCLADLLDQEPGCVFLSEAFTRPKVMYELTMRGFTQSYTYFAWRRHKWEIERYYTELFQTEVVEHFRPSSWPNTPDILTDQLQGAQRPLYVQRLVLAATLTANYGIYGPAFELMWSRARPGSEEYLDNAKYEIKRWDVDQPGSLAPVIALVNRIRREHPALQQDRTLRFHVIGNEHLIAYSKSDPSGRDVILVIVNLDPDRVQAGITGLDLEVLGVAADSPFEVHDHFGGGTFVWQGPDNYVELDPDVAPAHIFEVRATPSGEQQP